MLGALRLLVILRAKKILEPGSVYFLLSLVLCPLHRSTALFQWAAVSFQHVPSEIAVGVSPILLAVGAILSLKNGETLYDISAKAAEENYEAF